LLVLEIRVGESIKIGASTITLEDKSGKIARLSIEASKDVPISRVQHTSMATLAKAGIGATQN
jgi:sRNA-binding carbon storage regulator CsrA